MSRVTHFEISAQEPEKVLAFYESVFGWKSEKWNGPMDYWLIMTGDENSPGIDGGLGRKSEDSFPGTINTVDVTDIDAAIAKVKASNGSIVVDKMPVPGVGYLAYVADIEGNVFGMMQSDTSVGV